LWIDGPDFEEQSAIQARVAFGDLCGFVESVFLFGFGLPLTKLRHFVSIAANHGATPLTSMVLRSVVEIEHARHCISAATKVFPRAFVPFTYGFNGLQTSTGISENNIISVKTAQRRAPRFNF
jgi:hypothetical protein